MHIFVGMISCHERRYCSNLAVAIPACDSQMNNTSARATPLSTSREAEISIPRTIKLIYILSFIQTYIHTYVHTSIRTYVHMYIRAYVHMYTRT